MDFEGLKQRLEQSKTLFEYEATRSTQEVALRFIKEYDDWMEKLERQKADPEEALKDKKKEIEQLGTVTQRETLPYTI